MKICTPLQEYEPPAGGTSVALGFFDGVHRGHQALLAQARQGDYPAVVFTFRNHPASVVSSARTPLLLTDYEERFQLLQDAGLGVVWADFDRPFSQIEPREFVGDILLSRLGARRVISGANYRFGHRAAGTPSLLRECTNLKVEVVPDVLENGQVISSSRIRQALLEGRVKEAGVMLGRPFRISGRVLRGQQIGRKLDAPTANVSLNPDKVVPSYGVYAVQVTSKGTIYNAVANLGVRPTAQPEQSVPLLEAHLLDFADDLYGEPINVDFIERIRGEQRFSGLDELKAQIRLDIVTTRKHLQAHV